MMVDPVQSEINFGTSTKQEFFIRITSENHALSRRVHSDTRLVITETRGDGFLPGINNPSVRVTGLFPPVAGCVGL